MRFFLISCLQSKGDSVIYMEKTEAKGRENPTLAKYFRDGYVLVIDDMLNMRRTIKNLLRHLGINNVLDIGDGHIALKMLREGPAAGLPKYAVSQSKNSALDTLLENETIKLFTGPKAVNECLFILLDWNMPLMSGIEVAREIKNDEALRDIPILMITAEIEQNQVAKAGEIGVDGYLVKPFDGIKLSESMLNIIKAKENPPEFVRLIKQGEKLLEAGDHVNALIAFEKSRKLSDSARVQVCIGKAHEKGGDSDKAVEYYVAATQKNPKYLTAYIMAVNLYMKNNKGNLALQHLEKLCNISPNDPERQVLLGRLQLEAGNAPGAEKAFKNAMKYDKRTAGEIGEAYFKGGMMKQAEEYFREALKIGANDVHVYNRLGIILRGQGKWREAIEDYKKAIALEPDDEAILYNMGKAYLEGGNRMDAVDCFEKALIINPDLKPARDELGKLNLHW